MRALQSIIALVRRPLFAPIPERKGKVAARILPRHSIQPEQDKITLDVSLPEAMTGTYMDDVAHRARFDGVEESGPVVVMREVTKAYGIDGVTVHALRDICLEIQANRVTIILGPSGSGKTTLLNLIGGIDVPTAGKIAVRGREIQSLGERDLAQYRRMDVGFIFQFFNLIPSLTALENVEFVLECVMDAPPEQVRPTAIDLLQRVGLGDRMHHFPSQLSGGEQQRVAIARALAKRPSILLADEPTGELDFQTAKRIVALLTSMASEGRALVIVTHNQALAKIGHKVIRLKDGKVAHVETNADPASASELEW